MLRIGDPVFVGKRYGYIQRWGIERGFNSTKNVHPIRPCSRKQALKSNMPHIEIWFPKANVYEWWPLEATKTAPLNLRTDENDEPVILQN